jgi:hypothetical protein
MRPTRRAARPHRRPKADPLNADFGPGLAEEEASRRPASGPIPGLACAGDNCVLKPAADLIGRFILSLGSRGHGSTLSRAALSGIELMKALRDFLDTEIALVERAAGKRTEGRPPRYEKIRVE